MCLLAVTLGKSLTEILNLSADELRIWQEFYLLNVALFRPDWQRAQANQMFQNLNSKVHLPLSAFLFESRRVDATAVINHLRKYT